MKSYIPRYVPTHVIQMSGHGFGNFPVTSVIAHPPGNHPKNCPLIKECTAVEVKTRWGSSWYGVEKAWIDSTLRMVV